MLLEFNKLKNVRDIGGIETKYGKNVRSGLFVRCGYLWELDPEDKKKLSQMVDYVVDLRTDQEVEEKPDEKIEGAQYLHLPIFNEFRAGVTREESTFEMSMQDIVTNPKAAKEHMCHTYSYFAEDEVALSRYAKFVRLCIEDREKALLYHCTAGKDRTGIATAILYEILGVDRDYIIKDYLLTNEFLQDDYAALTGYVKSLLGPEGNSKEVEESLWYFFGAQGEFIKLYYDVIEKRYGNYDTYVREGLGITEEEVERLRNKALI